MSRILLGPEIRNFQRAAAAAQALAVLEDGRAAAQERAFRKSRTHDLRLLIGASIIAALLVVILLVTATDLARTAEQSARGPGARERRDAGVSGHLAAIRRPGEDSGHLVTA